MSRIASVRPEFVDYVPKELEDGVIYVSIEYSTAVHKCACGCGTKVATPISPARWILTFDGETVTLHPSIGNWSLDCQSHYWIDHNRIRWASTWTPQEIAEGRKRDRLARERHYQRLDDQDSSREVHEEQADHPGAFRRLWRRVRDAI